MLLNRACSIRFRRAGPPSGWSSSDQTLRRGPVGRIDEGDLLQQIRSSAYTLHRVHQRILVLDIQRAVISNDSKVVYEVGPERRAVGMAESKGHVVPGARTRFRDGDRVQQPVTR